MKALIKSAVASRFEAVVSSAVKALWDFSGQDLSRLGLVYHSRRNADKQQLFECVFADLISIFDTLDGDDSLHDMCCEARDLLALPSLELDPVSKQLEANTKVLQSLHTSEESLPSKVVHLSGPCRSLSLLKILLNLSRKSRISCLVPWMSLSMS